MRKYINVYLFSFIGLLLISALQHSYAQTQQVLVDQWLWPDYTLGQQAKNPKLHQWNRSLAEERGFIEPLPITYFGSSPTDRMYVPMSSGDGTFTVELWMVNHVNKPVGAAAYMRRKDEPTHSKAALVYYGDGISLSRNEQQSGKEVSIDYIQQSRGWKNRWLHVVGSYDGQYLRLYVNGVRVHQSAESGQKMSGKADLLEIAGYFAEEPYMQIGDLLKHIRVSDYAVSETDVAARYAELQKMVDNGKLIPKRFHLNAGPYLNNVTERSVDLVWETDRSARTVIRYGESFPLVQKVTVAVNKGEIHQHGVDSFIGKASLQHLKPGTTYFYAMEAVDERGDTVRSGTCTFATAPSAAQSVSFAVFGDTEGRPHINNQIAKRIWEERPDFALHLGDITDDGEEESKYEWNYEYFAGMGQLLERMAVYPVPGNGESDLYWFSRYHSPAFAKGYYQFSYGDIDFFMLDSNRPDEMLPEGKQYVWLENALKKSTAKWKFVAHHHAIYSSDDDDYGDSWKEKSTLGDPKLQKIIPLYEKYNVDMVFYGHLHTYQRTYPLLADKIDQKGVVYVQAGGAGGNLEDFTPTRSWFNAKTYRGYHFCTIGIVADRLLLQTFAVDGMLIDQTVITR